jgi:uncharacterized repeat protein (TIGR03803 family)
VNQLHAWKACSALFLICAAGLTTAQAQTFTTVYRFTPVQSDGENPEYMSLVQGTDGNLYGPTVGGGDGACSFEYGSSGCGTIFKLTPKGLTTLYNFSCYSPCDGLAFPVGTLALDNNGVLYGATEGGGNFFCNPLGCGGLFKITPSGELATLFMFTDSSQGYFPSGLTLANDGNLYGTTAAGGGVHCGEADYGCGTAFKLSPAGTFSVLVDFSPPDAFPIGQLTLGSNGELFGTANGYPASLGSVFKMSRIGAVRSLPLNNSSGAAYPGAGVIQGVDGNLYGITNDTSGLDRDGTVFKVTPPGQFTILHSFCQTDCSDGRLPDGPLMQATDGNLYGMTNEGGDKTCNPPVGCGTLFQISPDGAFVTLHTFEGPDGETPRNGLMQKTDGVLYGATYQGGVTQGCLIGGCGTIFSLDMGLGPFVSFVVSTGNVGETGGILGQGFTGTTAVSFNGIAANFTVRSDTYLTATVPPGATTGYVTVKTPTGVLTSNVPFDVIQ